MTNPIDSGCQRAGELLEFYVEAALAGRDPERLYPDIAAHHRDCPACKADHDGLLEALGAVPFSDDPYPTR